MRRQGPRIAALRVLGMHPDTPGAAPFVKAGGVLSGARSLADLRSATDLVAQANPALFGRAMTGDMAAMGVLRAVAQGTLEPGSAYETGDSDEERAIVVQLVGERKSDAEIQAALDEYRANVRRPMAEERRNSPGVATMSTALADAAKDWLALSVRTKDGARIPGQVANKLAGRRFKDFDSLRRALWMTIADTPELAEGFSPSNLARMRLGYAPMAPDFKDGSRYGRFELHHDPAIGNDGPVFDLSTIRVVTPGQHDSIHYESR